MIRRKYQKDREILMGELVARNRKAMILSIELVGLSKVADHVIYEVVVLDAGKEKTVPVIAIDVTQALAKLETYIDSGIPEATMRWMLGNERNINL